MSYESDIYTALQAAAPVTALVAARIYPDAAPGDAASPYIAYQTISAYGTTTHDGVTGITHPLIQFSCWAGSRPQAVAIAAAVRAALITGAPLPGDSEAWLSFSNESGDRDQETALFGQIIELRATCKTNS